MRGSRHFDPLEIQVQRVQKVPHLAALVVRSPFRAKHHVVVQYMVAGWKCPLPPPPPQPPPLYT